MATENTHSRRSFLKGTAIATGAATLGSCVTSTATPVITQSQVPSFHPRHNERTKGWLRFLWQKATTPDDWNYTGEEELPWGIKLPRGPLEDYAFPKTKRRERCL